MITKTQTLESSCSFWSLTQGEQQAIADKVPKRDAWTLSLRRNLDGSWEFDIPEFKTFSELLIGNTEKVLDIHYGNLSECRADEYSTMDVTISRIPIADETTSCTFVQPCKDSLGASVYLDLFTNQEFWLCPYLRVLFKDAPNNLYLKMDVTS
jgi:hypothetical protein